MEAHHISQRNLTDLYRKAVRKLSEGVEDSTLKAALSLSADYLDKAMRRLEELEYQAIEQADLEEALRDQGR